MKNKSLVSLIMAGALLLTVAGCKKEEPVVPKAAEQPGTAAQPATDAAQSVAAGAEKIVADVKEASAKVDSIIAQAKALVDQAKYQDALNALAGLSGMTLSEAQQKIVDGLNAQIQKALANKAAESGASAVGKLLGK